MNHRMPKALFLALACACFAVGPLHAAPLPSPRTGGEGQGEGVPATLSGTELQLAFWNIRDLSTNSRDATELRQITQGRRALLDADSIHRIESACRH